MFEYVGIHIVLLPQETTDGSQEGHGVKVAESTFGTYNQVFADRTGAITCDVDFSPDSTRLASTIADGTALFGTSRRTEKCKHHGKYYPYSTKYLPQGDRIATATDQSVQVWDSDDGRLLVDVKV